MLALPRIAVLGISAEGVGCPNAPNSNSGGVFAMRPTQDELAKTIADRCCAKSM